MASSSSSSWTYDVFLSFRGQGTRRGFTSNLYDTLRQSGIHAFVDNTGIEKGEEISSSLLLAIERSRIAIIVFYPDYASSGWCLDELVKIMECRRSLGQVVIPIFYKIEPSDVGHQTGRYGEAMEQHKQRGRRDKLELWRAALKEAADLSGFPEENQLESEIMGRIVEDVSSKVDVGQLFVAEHPVGIGSRVHELTIGHEFMS